MKTIFKLKTIMIIAICFAMVNGNVNAQGSGDHLTMSLQNCTQPTANTMQFDLYVVSDGSASSDLRANSFQCGINFNKSILQPGATLKTTYINNTSEFLPLLNGFNFPASVSADHIRIVESVYSKGNTGVTMIVGKPYKIGRFQLTSSENWVAGKNPEFELQTSVVPGKTVCAALAWVGAAASTNGITIPGSSNSMARGGYSGSVSLSVNVGCRMEASSMSNEQAMSVYPNPTGGLVTVHFNSPSSADYHLTVVDMISREVMVKEGKAVEGINSLELDLGNLAKGIYMMNLKSGAFTGAVRTVIE